MTEYLLMNTQQQILQQDEHLLEAAAVTVKSMFKIPKMLSVFIYFAFLQETFLQSNTNIVRARNRTMSGIQ
jgi:hypothetical protein